MKKENPEIICGVDFSGSPNHGNFRDFKPILEKARKNGLKLALHCGEVENSLEINDMLQFGMDRLGHGTFIRGLYDIFSYALVTLNAVTLNIIHVFM